MPPLTDRARDLNPPHDQRQPRSPCHPALPGRTFGYARVSTVAQADESQSLDVQQRTIAGYAQMHGLTVERVFVERGVLGSKPLATAPTARRCWPS